jgi:hypothetical protein
MQDEEEFLKVMTRQWRIISTEGIQSQSLKVASLKKGGRSLFETLVCDWTSECRARATYAHAGSVLRHLLLMTRSFIAMYVLIRELR